MTVVLRPHLLTHEDGVSVQIDVHGKAVADPVPSGVFNSHGRRIPLPPGVGLWEDGGGTVSGYAAFVFPLDDEVIAQFGDRLVQLAELVQSGARHTYVLHAPYTDRPLAEGELPTVVRTLCGMAASLRDQALAVACVEAERKRALAERPTASRASTLATQLQRHVLAPLLELIDDTAGLVDVNATPGALVATLSHWDGQGFATQSVDATAQLAMGSAALSDALGRMLGPRDVAEGLYALCTLATPLHGRSDGWGGLTALGRTDSLDPHEVALQTIACAAPDAEPSSTLRIVRDETLLACFAR